MEALTITNIGPATELLLCARAIAPRAIAPRAIAPVPPHGHSLATEARLVLHASPRSYDGSRLSLAGSIRTIFVSGPATDPFGVAITAITQTSDAILATRDATGVRECGIPIIDPWQL